MSSPFGGLRNVTLILLRNDLAILGEEGKDMEEAAESAPFLLGGGGGGDKIVEDRPHEGTIPESVNGGREGGISLQPGELRLPLQCPGLARKFGPWHPLEDTARPRPVLAMETESAEVTLTVGSLLEVTEWRVKG